MPYTNDFPPNATSTVAKELSRGLPSGKGPGTSVSTVKVTESFQVWSLAADRVTSTGSADLVDLAVDTGLWHHQISSDGRPAYYARSKSADDPSDWQLSQVFESPLAAKFDEAVKWIEANEQRDLLVRVLDAPSYHLEALWLVGRSGESFVLVVDAAIRLRDLVGLRLSTSAEFLQRLREVRPVKGVVLEKGTS